MRKILLLLAAASAIIGSSIALAPERADSAALSTSRTISYGSAPLQALDFWAGGSRAPVVVFVHGGGWSQGDKRMMTGSAKLSHWQAAGYAVASVNYRLVPDATVEQQAQDVADAVAALKSRADQLGIDPKRIALVGHSAGAHLVALVGTDSTYLRNAGLSFADIAGVVPLDGAAFDVPAQIGAKTIFTGRMIAQAFGNNPARQAALSPTRQAGAPNVARFEILHIDRPDSRLQSGELAAALRRGGSEVEIAAFPGRGLRGHAEINRRMGDPDYPATPVLDAFLARIFA